MKHKLAWALGGLAAAVGFYELWIKPTHVPAGYTPIAIQPGSVTAVAPAGGGLVGFVLPSGGRWVNAAEEVNGAAQTRVPLPSDTRAPLLVTGVGNGSGLLMQWTDANGRQQASGVLFI
jgi:hypothetical protein